MSKILTRILEIILIAAFIAFGIYFFTNKYKEDRVPPVITCRTGNLEVSINDGEDVLLANVTAQDNRDGDITDKVVVESISKFSDTETATARITYAVCDSSENLSRVSCNLIYTDYTPIRYKINSSTRCKLSSSVTPLSFITAEDCIDGDITRKIRYEALGTKDFSVYSEGSYGIRYSVVNSMGDIEYFDVMIDVYNPPSNIPASYLPQLYLNRYNVYLKTGDDFDPNSYLAYAIVDGERVEMTAPVKRRITALHDVDTSAPGTYRVIYEYSPDKSQYDVKAEAVLYVVVE